MDHIQVFTTIDSKEAAEKLASAVLNERVAACVQIVGPVSSSYWWKGKIDRAEERLCIMKSRTNLYRQLETVVRANHSYEVPEIMAIPIEAGFDGYLKWMEGELKK